MKLKDAQSVEMLVTCIQKNGGITLAETACPCCHQQNVMSCSDSVCDLKVLLVE